ncbi:MAG: rhomboid family intramembrane serine protease, partial [Planctomycetota bacterium]|nr:rhomboid family intramembrane serine protease [Planctomycetota bacterium]
MFLPIRDAPNPPGVAVVNYALIAVNVAVFLLITVPLGLQELDPNDPAAAEFLRQRVELYGRQALQVPASAYDIVVHRYGYRPAEGSALSLLTSMFLHGGFMHLAGNMLFLWIYGDNVEARLGRVRYLIAYLLSGTAATLFFSAFDSSSQIPLVGASGAISGVLGFYFVFFPRNVV